MTDYDAHEANKRLEQVQMIADRVRKAINQVDDSMNFHRTMCDIARIAQNSYVSEFERKLRIKKQVVVRMQYAMSIISGVIAGIFAFSSFIALMGFLMGKWPVRFAIVGAIGGILFCAVSVILYSLWEENKKE